MPYIGNQPITGNFIKLDTISVVNGQASYTMQKDSANFSPASANHMLVSLNGIIQNPGSSFTISNHTITFASNLVTGDVINFIIVLGDVLNIGTPSDNTVTNDKLATAPTLISKGAGGEGGAIQLNCEVNSHGVKLKSPDHSAGQSWTLKLPDNSPTADKFLKVKSITGSGATAVGQMEFASAGGLVKLAEVTDSTNQSFIEFTGLYAYGATYQTLIISHSHATGTGEIRCEIKGVNQSSYYNTAYYWCAVTGRPNNNVNTYGVSNGSYGKLLGSFGESHGYRGNIIIHDPRNVSNGSRVAIEYLQTGWNNASSVVVAHGVIGLGTTTGIDAIKYYHASSNMSAGNAVLYGVLK